MNGYIDALGNYYEGDRQGDDLVVPQRPDHTYSWSGTEWVPPAGPSVAELIAAKRAAIEARRDTEEQKGCTYSFPGGVEDVVQLRDERDKLNLNGQVTAALILKGQGVTDEVMPFQAESNATHMLSPDEMIAMGTAVNNYCLGLYQKQWQQKSLLDALDPATATAADVAAIADWPADPAPPSA